MHLANGQTVLPMAELPLNEASGTTASDVTGNGWNGTLTGGASWTTGIKGGRSGPERVQASMLHLPAGVVSSANAITVAAWVNLDTVSSWSRIFDFGRGTRQLLLPDAAKRDNRQSSAVGIKNGGGEQSHRRHCGAGQPAAGIMWP